MPALRATFTVKTAAELARIANFANHRNKSYWQGFPPETLLFTNARGDRQADGSWACEAELVPCIGPDDMGYLAESDGTLEWKLLPNCRYGEPVEFAELGLVLALGRDE